MRYMPDRVAFYALFTVHVQFEGASDDHQVYRTYKQLGALHSRVSSVYLVLYVCCARLTPSVCFVFAVQIQKKFPKSKFPKDLPTMRKKRYDNEYIEQKKQVCAACVVCIGSVV